MPDPTYIVPDNPTYNPEIRALQDSDPAKASTVFNPVLQQMIENTHAVKLAADALSERISGVEEETGNTDNITLPSGQTLTEALNEINEDKAETNSPAFSGTPTAPTPKTASNDTSIATTAFVKAQGYVTEEHLNEAVSELKMFALAITFSASMQGQSFTVTGGGMSTYSGTVPETLSATVAVPTANTTYTVSCSGKNKTVTTGSYYGIYPVHVDTISTTLAENSWAQIAAVSNAGNAESYWKVGDEIDVVINGETLTFQIFGFNHDNLTDGGKAGITFGMKNLMSETRQMNTTDTNSGGFTGSAMYDWLQNTLFPELPEDLRSVIRPVDKKSSSGSQSTTIKTESMKLFLFSAIENCLRTTTNVYKDEGETYPIFTDNASRIKRLTNGAGSAHTWWERSPSASLSNGFCMVTGIGNASSDGASNSCGVCFGFCL